MAYIRHDENNDEVSSQPGKTSVTQFGGNEGWTSVTYENFNADYQSRNVDNTTRTPGTYQRHDENNSAVTPGTYQRHDENNSPVTG